MDKTLQDLLRLYNLSSVAREMTALGIPTSRDRVSRIALGHVEPTVRELPALATILRVDVSDLVKSIARDGAVA